MLKTCFGRTNLTGHCTALDLQRNDTIGLADYHLFHDIVAGR